MQRIVLEIYEPVSFIEVFGLDVQSMDSHCVDANLVGNRASTLQCIYQQDASQSQALGLFVYCEPPYVSCRNRVFGQPHVQIIRKISKGHAATGKSVVTTNDIRFK